MIRYLLISLRPKHWIKNGFVLVPLVFGHQLFNYPENVRVLAAFALFCLMSSAMYLINDVEDREKDRAHRAKRLRPIASGKLALGPAVAVAVLLAAISLGCSRFVAPGLGWILLAYFVLNLLYSRYFKHIVILDVFCLGFFFLLRIAAGTVAADVEFSYWMIFMVFLLAMFLGFGKRRQELKTLKAGAEAGQRAVLSQYDAYFIDQMVSVLTSSIVVVYMIYTVDARTIHEFGTTHLIYTVPFVYYGIFRYLFLIHRKRMGEDPTLILLSDGPLLVNLASWIAVCVYVIYFGI